MKTALAILFLMLVTPAMAGQCFHNQDGWTLTKTEDGFVWRQGSKSQKMQTTGAGTGVPVVVAWDNAGEPHPYEYRAGRLIFDKTVYEPGCE